MIGASQVLVSGIESGRINPRTSEIQRIAECLGYIHSPDTLLLPYKEWVKLFGQSVVEDKILTSTVKVLED
jgi:predicted transcriptional regulator